MSTDEYALQVRPPAPLTRQELFQARLVNSRARLDAALDRVRQATRELTPAARIAEEPLAWVLRALVFGLAVGLLTGRRRR